MRRYAFLLGSAALLLACRETPSTVASATRLGIGSTPAQALIDSLDIDVDTSGNGLPAGHGDARRGAELFRAQCAACHGASGEGMEPAYPKLVAREPATGFPFASDFKISKTIGNYWPHATTLFDYIRRAMPLTAPRSLSDDDVYSLTAYLLAANGVIAPDATLDRSTLLAVRMPARDRFVDDDRRGGREIR
ncbi:MAG: cytochrome c [Gemmatimonadota bacterium]